jgi:hypothetical protein
MSGPSRATSVSIMAPTQTPTYAPSRLQHGWKMAPKTAPLGTWSSEASVAFGTHEIPSPSVECSANTDSSVAFPRSNSDKRQEFCSASELAISKYRAIGNSCRSVAFGSGSAPVRSSCPRSAFGLRVVGGPLTYTVAQP